jgi:hypothetical protein
MWKTFWIGAGAVVFLLVFVGCLISQTTFLFVHPRAPDARIVIDRATGAAVVTGEKFGKDGKVLPAKQPPAGTPRAEVPEREFDFGMMNPLTMGQHAFVVRNTGTAPLQLKLGGTTCKCTIGKLKDHELPPGDQTEVTLEWNTGRDLEYSHGGTLLTNDPDNKRIELQVRGRVLTVLRADVKEVVFPRIDPGEPAQAEVFLYSQVWEDFEVVAGQCGLTGLTWQALPVPGDLVPEDLHAKHAQLLRISTAPDLPSGEFNDVLRLEVKDLASSENRQIVLPIHGTVGKRLAIYGPAIDSKGIIDLGANPVGQGKKVKMLVKVRDAEPTLDKATLTVTPSWLKAQLTRHPGDAAKGLYDLTVELPGETEPCQYLGNPRGQVRIDTGHPRIGVVELGVTFAVLPRS